MKLKNVTELNRLNINKMLVETAFNGQEPDQERRYLLSQFDGDVAEVNDFLLWRKEDKEYFTKELKRLLRLVENSIVED